MTTTPTSKPTVRRRVNANRPVDQATQGLLALPGMLRSWYQIKRQVAELNNTLTKGKASIKTVVLAHGAQDEKGSQYLELAEPVEGISSIKNQRTVRRGYNEDKAREICTRKKIWDEVTRTVVEIDPDKLQLAYFNKKITKAELDAIFPDSVTYSLILLDANGRQVS